MHPLPLKPTQGPFLGPQADGLLITYICMGWFFTTVILFHDIIKYSVYGSGFPMEPGKPGDFNCICPGPAITSILPQQVRKLRQNKKFSRRQESNLECNIQILYWNKFLKCCTPLVLECLWCLPFGAKIVCIITWRIAFLIWTKPGNNLVFYC